MLPDAGRLAASGSAWLYVAALVRSRLGAAIDSPTETAWSRGQASALQQPRRERQEVVQPFVNDTAHDVQIESLVVVHGDVSEPHHPLHAAREFLVQVSGTFEQVECLAAVLRHTEPVDPHQVHRQVDAALAGPLQIENDRVLTGLIGDEVGVVAGMLLAVVFGFALLAVIAQLVAALLRDAG